MKKGAFIGLAVGIVLPVLLSLMLDVDVRATTIDVHVHDTYFILSYFYLLLLIVLFLGTLISFGALAGSHFKSKWLWSLFLIFTVAGIYFFTV